MFGLSDHLKQLSAHGDPLDELVRIIDFEAFRSILVVALAYGDGAKGGRPPYDPVTMLKILVLAAQNNVADAWMQPATQAGPSLRPTARLAQAKGFLALSSTRNQPKVPSTS